MAPAGISHDRQAAWLPRDDAAREGRGAGLGFDHTREASTLYVSVGARAGVQLPLGSRLAVRLMGDGDVPLIPTRLDAGGSVVWTTPPFAASAVLMLIGRFR